MIHGFFGLRCEGNRDGDPEFDGTPSDDTNKNSTMASDDNDWSIDDSWKNIPPRQLYRFAFHYSTLLVIIVISGIAIGIELLVLGHFDKPPAEYWDGYVRDIPNPLNPNEKMQLVVNLKSKTFAAQDNITAYVTLRTDWTELHRVGQNLPRNGYRINFNGTSCGQPQDPYEIRQFCSILLVPTNTAFYHSQETLFDVSFRGNGEILYSHGGIFDVVLSNETFSIYDPTTAVGTDFIQIGDTQSTLALNQARDLSNTWKVTATIAIIAAVATGLNVYFRFAERKFRV